MSGLALIGYYPNLVRRGVFCGLDLVSLAKRLWRLEAMRADKPVPTLKFRASRYPQVTGRAWAAVNRLVLSIGEAEINDVVEALLHELAHCACPEREYHGELFQRRLIASAREAFGLQLDTAFLLDIEIGSYSKRAYAIDAAIRDAMKDAKIGERLRDEPTLRFESPLPEPEERVIERRAAARTSIVNGRAQHAAKMLAEWERRERHAKRLAAKWRRRVKYYGRTMKGSQS